MAEAKKQIYIKKLNPRAMTLKKSHRCTPCPTPTRTLPDTPPIRPFLYCSYIVYILFLYCSYILPSDLLFPFFLRMFAVGKHIITIVTKEYN